jgi:hypothetical protein
MKTKPEFETLKDALADWKDFDAAAYKLACCLGVLPFPSDGPPPPKSLFWGANVLGESLVKILDDLVKADVLEFDDSGTNLRYRWNRNFKSPS